MNPTKKMSKLKKQAVTLMAAALITGVVAPFNVMAAESFTDMGQSGSYRTAIEALAKQGVLSGYADGTVKPMQQINRAELAKTIVKGLGLTAPTTGASDVVLEDVADTAWYAADVKLAVSLGLLSVTDGKVYPKQAVTVHELTIAIAKAISRNDVITVQGWLPQGTMMNGTASRGQAALLTHHAKPYLPSATAEIVKIKAINPVTLEVTFTAPITSNDAALTNAAKNIVFDHGLTLPNQPQLMTGSKATYIVPTTPQKAGTVYSLTYKAKLAGTFEASTNLISMNTARQVTVDTFEIESLLSEGVTDYENIVASASGLRGELEFTLDKNNRYQAKTYQIISSMRGKQVSITPEGGETIVASYVPYTQSTDGRQAPKFRLPQGVALKPSVKYTVTSNWATIKQATFTAIVVSPLVVASVKAVNETTLEVSMTHDPKDELFAGRGVKLIAPDGGELVAQYKVTTRKGPLGTFEVAVGDKLVAGTPYKVTPVGSWALADNVTVTLSGK